MHDHTGVPRRHSAGRLALLGLVLVLAGFALGSAAGVLFPEQDPAGKAMMSGLLFLAGAGSGLVLLILAVILTLRGRGGPRV